MANSKIKQDNNSKDLIKGNISYTFEATNLTFKKETGNVYQNNNNNYAYVIKDLKKTFIISLLLIGLEFILFILVKNNFIKIPVI